MRKLKLQMQITLDGFVAGPQGELDWMTTETDDEQDRIMQGLTDDMDTILMGRKMTLGFTTHWENLVNQQPDNPEYAYAKIFVDTPKVVFSRTVDLLPGRNVRVENGDLEQAVRWLKVQPGKDMIVYGGATFVSQLLCKNLIDELYLIVNPVAIGDGLRIFKNRFDYKLIQSTPCKNGVVINRYEQKK